MTAAAPRSSSTPWLVRAGRGAEHIQRWVDGGFASISWARIPHLGDLRDHADEEILGLLRAAERGQPAADLRATPRQAAGVIRRKTDARVTE